MIDIHYFNKFAKLFDCQKVYSLNRFISPPWPPPCPPCPPPPPPPI